MRSDKGHFLVVISSKTTVTWKFWHSYGRRHFNTQKGPRKSNSNYIPDDHKQNWIFSLLCALLFRLVGNFCSSDLQIRLTNSSYSKSFFYKILVNYSSFYEVTVVTFFFSIWQDFFVIYMKNVWIILSCIFAQWASVKLQIYVWCNCCFKILYFDRCENLKFLLGN